MVDVVCKALGEFDEETKQMIRDQLRNRRDASDNRLAGAHALAKGLASDERRARIERKRRASFDALYPESRRLVPRNPLEVGIDPHATRPAPTIAKAA